MSKGRWVQSMAGRLLAMCVVLALGAGQSMAQPKPKAGELNECKSGAGCVEVTIRYSDNGTVQIVDSQTGRAIPNCRICNPKTDPKCTIQSLCKGATGSIDHAGTLQLFKTHSNPICTLICSSSGYCKETCR